MSDTKSSDKESEAGRQEARELAARELAVRRLAALEATDWRFLGEVPHIVDPRDTEALILIWEVCRQRLRQVRNADRHRRLEMIRRRLRTHFVLNRLLPVAPPPNGARRAVSGPGDPLGPRIVPLGGPRGDNTSAIGSADRRIGEGRFPSPPSVDVDSPGPESK